MPNYSIVIDSTFKPFTYQELTAPLDRAEAYHEKLAQEYDTLSSQADILEAMGKDDKDNKTGAYSRYKAYSDYLRKEAGDLYRYGVNTESRRILSDVRRMYNTNIVPIQNAWNKRIKEAETQQTAENNNPLLRFSRRAADTNIDYYVDNPEGGYDVVNLESVYKTAANMYKSLAKLKREGRLEQIDPYTNAFVREYGVDPALISDWMQDPSKSKILTSMMNQALSTNGLNRESFANSSVLDEAKAFAQAAAWESVGESKEQVLDNYYNRQALASSLRMKEKQQENAGTGNGGANWFNFHQDSIPIASADKNNSAGYVNGYWQNYKNDSWSGKARTMRVQEIAGKDKDGNLKLKSDVINLGQLLQKNDKYNPNNETVSAFLINQEGQEGYIFQVNGKQYFADISADRSDDVLNARNSFKEANNAVAQISSKKQELNNIMVNPNIPYDKKQNLQAQIISEIQALETYAQRNTSNGLSSMGAAYNQYTHNPDQAVVEQPSQTNQFKTK